MVVEVEDCNCSHFVHCMINPTSEMTIIVHDVSTWPNITLTTKSLV